MTLLESMAILGVDEKNEKKRRKEKNSLVYTIYGGILQKNDFSLADNNELIYPFVGSLLKGQLNDY